VSRAQRNWVMVTVGVALLGCTLASRLPSALNDALWEDEIGAQHVIALPTLAGSLRQIVTHESTPPVYYVLARTVDRVAGALATEARARIVRALSILFSLGCTGLTFILALRLLPLWPAALAGFLASLGAVLVVHGSELRAYSLLAFASVLFALTLERAVAEPTRRRLSELACVVALGSLTHYFFLFTLAAGALWLVVAETSRSVRRSVGAALLVGLIPLAAWSPAWIYQWRHGSYATTPPFSLDRFVEVVPSLFAPQAVVSDTGLFLRTAATLAILAPAILLLRRNEGRLVSLLTLVPLIAVSLVAWIAGERIFNTRNMIGVAPFAAIALAWGCASLPWRRASLIVSGLVALLVAAGFAYGQASLGRTPYERLADDLRAQGLRNDEPIVWFGNDGGIAPVTWYLTTRADTGIWPQFVLSTPTEGACSAVQVVVRTDTGRHWLDDHRDGILEQSSTPSFGDRIQGKRGTDIIVARLRWTDGSLDFPQHDRNRVIFHVAGSRSPCLRP